MNKEELLAKRVAAFRAGIKSLFKEDGNCRREWALRDLIESDDILSQTYVEDQNSKETGRNLEAEAKAFWETVYIESVRMGAINPAERADNALEKWREHFQSK